MLVNLFYRWVQFTFAESEWLLNIFYASDAHGGAQTLCRHSHAILFYASVITIESLFEPNLKFNDAVELVFRVNVGLVVKHRYFSSLIKWVACVHPVHWLA